MSGIEATDIWSAQRHAPTAISLGIASRSQCERLGRTEVHDADDRAGRRGGGELKTKTKTKTETGKMEEVRGRGVSEKWHEDKMSTPGSKRAIDSKQEA